jgi:ASC-1-like (ASCH) protein
MEDKTILEHKVLHEYFELIKNGDKRAEVRLFDPEKHSDLMSLDKIKLTNTETGEFLIFDIDTITVGKFKEEYCEDVLNCVYGSFEAKELVELGIIEEEVDEKYDYDLRVHYTEYGISHMIDYKSKKVLLIRYY